MSRPVMMALILLAVSSALQSSWFSVWVLIELMLILFLASASVEPEAKLKYFVLQTISSLGWLLSVVSPIHLSVLFFMMLLLKLGLAPFFFWVPIIYTGAGIYPIVVLSTIMKLPGIILISHYSGPALLTTMLFSVLLGSLGGWGVAHIKKLLAWSSITNTSWLCILISAPMWAVLYLTMYIIILSSFAAVSSAYFVDASTQTLGMPPTAFIPYSCIWMSLAGLPPLTGFIMKWISIEALAAASGVLSTCYVIIMAVSLYYYLQVILMTTTSIASSTRPHPPMLVSVMVLVIMNAVGLFVFAHLA